MKRIVLLICFTVCLLSLLIGTAFAHPGGTDEDGGHKNHSTGDYHYHHGYPAHEHYDMDGDMIYDCPYEFDDKTDVEENSGTSSKNNSTSKTDYLSILGGIIAVGLYVFFMFILPFLI